MVLFVPVTSVAIESDGTHAAVENLQRLTQRWVLLQRKYCSDDVSIAVYTPRVQLDGELSRNAFVYQLKDKVMVYEESTSDRPRVVAAVYLGTKWWFDKDVSKLRFLYEVDKVLTLHNVSWNAIKSCLTPLYAEYRNDW